MKTSKLIMCAITIASLGWAANQAQAVQYDLPTIPVNISGVVAYQGSSTNVGPIATTTIRKHSFNNKTLISLLNQSSTVTNTMAQVTGTNQIPAGSFIVFNIYDETLIVTNKNGFSFPLYGYTQSTGYYDYGYLDFDEDVLFGRSSLNTTTGAGTEKDFTGVEFYFDNEGSGDNYVELEPEYGNGSFEWTFGKVANGKQTAAVKFHASPAGYYAYVGNSEGITTSCTISGSGKASIYSLNEPFYQWW